jgi:hypothetical protein
LGSAVLAYLFGDAIQLFFEVVDNKLFLENLTSCRQNNGKLNKKAVVTKFLFHENNKILWVKGRGGRLT